jgi:hypothetical protein
VLRPLTDIETYWCRLVFDDMTSDDRYVAKRKKKTVGVVCHYIHCFVHVVSGRCFTLSLHSKVFISNKLYLICP